MESILQKSIEGLITVFQSYSEKEGDKYKLNKAELKSLLKEEFPELLEGSNENEEVTKILTDLDENQDGEVDFQEFVTLVVALTVVYHEFFKLVDCME